MATVTRQREQNSCPRPTRARTPMPPSAEQVTATTATATPAIRGRPRRTRGSRAPGRFADSWSPGQGQPGYQENGYAQPGYPQPPRRTHSQPGYAGSSYAAGEIDMAYPAAAETPHGADLYKQPWDYDQPLRYDGEEDTYQAPDSYQHDGRLRRGRRLRRPGERRGRALPAARFRPRRATTAPTTRCRASTVPATTCPASSAPATSRRSATTSRATGASPMTTRATMTGRVTRSPGSASTRPASTCRGLTTPGSTTCGWPARMSAARPAPPDTGMTGSETAAVVRNPFLLMLLTRRRSARSAETRYDMKALAEPGDNTRFDVPGLRRDAARQPAPAHAGQGPADLRRRSCSRRRPPGRATGPRTPRSTTSPTST